VRNEESVLLETAKAAERSGNYVAAFGAWQSLSSMTNRPDYLCKLGRVAQKLGRWTDAEKAFLDALKLDKTFSLAMVGLGSLFLARADGDQSTNARRAKAWFEQAVAAAPSPMSLNFLGDAHNRLGEKEAAKSAFRKTIALDASYAEAYFNLGLLLANDGQNEEAERLLRTATQLDPNYHEAHGRLGMLLQELGKYSEAEAELRRAIEIDPTDAIADFYLNRGTGSAGRNKLFKRGSGVSVSERPCAGDHGEGAQARRGQDPPGSQPFSRGGHCLL
jgi:tetratricopeptide (TPR) repeat protein